MTWLARDEGRGGGKRAGEGVKEQGKG